MWKGPIPPPCQKPLKKINYFPSAVLQKSISTGWEENFLKLNVGFKIPHEDFVHKMLGKMETMPLQKPPLIQEEDAYPTSGCSGVAAVVATAGLMSVGWLLPRRNQQQSSHCLWLRRIRTSLDKLCPWLIGVAVLCTERQRNT